jgi:transposase
MRTVERSFKTEFTIRHLNPLQRVTHMTTAFEGYWGIDVSKQWLDITVDEKTVRIKQTPQAIEDFIKANSASNVLAVLESTGGYEKLMARCLIQRGITVHVAHPNKVNAFAKAKGRLAKSDQVDSRLLKEYGKFISPTAIKPYPSETQEALEQLGARLEQLKSLHHQEACRQGQATSQLVKKSIKDILELLKQELEQIEKAILAIVNSEAVLKEKYELLLSMKGVGKTIALTLITHLPELGEANKKEIAALVGVAPITQQSGQKIGKARIRYGRQHVRKTVYMGALTACRYNAKFKQFYEKLIHAGKPKKIAIVAVMRKMIVTLNAMIQSKTPFLT